LKEVNIKTGYYGLKQAPGAAAYQKNSPLSGMLQNDPFSLSELDVIN